MTADEFPRWASIVNALRRSPDVEIGALLDPCATTPGWHLDDHPNAGDGASGTDAERAARLPGFTRGPGSRAAQMARRSAAARIAGRREHEGNALETCVARTAGATHLTVVAALAERSEHRRRAQ
jgi:hypothetical protein